MLSRRVRLSIVSVAGLLALAGLVTMPVVASAYVPPDVWDALEYPAAIDPPWLERGPSCRTPTLADLEATPYACMPPVSTTLGFTSDSIRYVSLESEIEPGCGDPVAERFERRRTRAKKPFSTKPLSTSGGTLSEQLARLWSAVDGAVADGYVPSVPVILGTALITSKTATHTAAVALGPPLADHIVYVDRLRKQISLYLPDGTRKRLAALPTAFVADGVQPSLWELAISPDARRMVIRLAALRGTPCDPAAMRVFQVRVPVPPDRTAPDNTGFGLRQACRNGDRDACVKRCETDPRACSESGQVVLEQGPRDEPTLDAGGDLLLQGCRRDDMNSCLGVAETFEERCRDPDARASEACKRLGNQLDRRPGPRRRTGKSRFRRPSDLDKRMLRKLRRVCMQDGLACLKLAKIYRDGGYNVQRNSRYVRKYARKAVVLLRARCADNVNSCEALREAEAIVAE